MPGLFHALRNTSSTLNAYSRAIEAEGLNVSNASTPGWAALKVAIRPVGLAGAASDTVDITSSGDARADAIVRAATAEASYSQTSSAEVTPVNQTLDITGETGILSALRGFSTAFANLSVNPNDSGLRAAGIGAAQTLALEFNRATVNLDTIQNKLDSSIQSTVSQINSLSATIAGFNDQLRSKSDFDPQLNASLRSTLDTLSSLVNITTSTNTDGTVTVLAGVLFPAGVRRPALAAWGILGPAGQQVISAAGGTPPAQALGSLGGLLDVRNNAIVPLIGGNGQTGALNTLAAGFATRVNALLASGTTPAGTAGKPLFTWSPGDPANVARTLSIDPAFTASDLALASATQANGVANNLAALSTSTQAADLINGQSAEGLFATTAAAIGKKTADVTAQASQDASAQTSAEISRQNISGVSLDKEAVLLTAGQRAYEAAARLFQSLNSLTETEVNLIK